MAYAGTTLKEAYSFLARGLTVTEGNWPRRVIDALEASMQDGRHTPAMVAAKLHGFTMAVSYPPEHRVDGLRWFYGRPL